MNSVNQASTSRRNHQPSPAAVVGNILALGVVRVLARVARERNHSSPPATHVPAKPRREKKQFIVLK